MCDMGLVTEPIILLDFGVSTQTASTPEVLPAVAGSPDSCDNGGLDAARVTHLPVSSTRSMSSLPSRCVSAELLATVREKGAYTQHLLTCSTVHEDGSNGLPMATGILTPRSTDWGT